MKTETQTEEMLFRTIEDEFKTSLSAMKEFHADWREFDDYYLAKQWNTQRANWRPDPVVNYVSYTVDQKKPQLTNSRPTGIILPTAENDGEAAHLFTQVTDVISERVDLDSTIEDVVQTGLLLDIAWFKVYWDNTISGGNLNRQNVWKGDVEIESVDPANIYFDPQATSVDECRWIIYAVPKTVQWIKEKFDTVVEPDSVQSFETEIYNRTGQEQADGRVMLYERWYRENGKLNCIYAAGRKILKHIDGVYKHNRYPFIPFVAKKRRKSILGIGEPRNIFNNQKLLNKMLEVPTTIALLTQNPIALVDPTSGIDVNKWTNKPGQVWQAKNPRDAVHWLQSPQLPNDFYKLADILTTYIERIGGVYDAMTGETPKGVTAARAIQLLQEQGSIPIKGIARNLYSCLKEVYRQTIALVQEFYTEERYMRITGEEGQTEFIRFNGAKYAEIDFDVKVSAGASTPMSRAYIAQLADDLFSKNLLLPSEYVDMQDGLPNKERIVSRLKEQEQAIPQQPPGGQQTLPSGPQPNMQMPQLDDIYANAPPELQQEIDLMREQRIPEEQIVQMLMQMIQ